jgi:hypothetical protein
MQHLRVSRDIAELETSPSVFPRDGCKDVRQAADWSSALKSYPERIADVLVNAPPAPPLRRKHAADAPRVSELTQAKLIMIHTMCATFGHPPEAAQERA